MDAMQCALLLAVCYCAVALSELEILKHRSGVNDITSNRFEPIIIAITNFNPDETPAEETSDNNENVAEDTGINTGIDAYYENNDGVIPQNISKSIKTLLSPNNNDEDENLIRFAENGTNVNISNNTASDNSTDEPITTYTVRPTPTTTAKSIFVPQPLECPKEKLPIKTTRTKFKPKYLKMREFPFHEDGVLQEDHKFYKSRIITNSTYFEAHWANITNSPNKIITHPIATTDTFQHAYMKKLQFQFPYFGHNITNVTISTGGYLMTGVAGLSWSADAQGLEPFMTDFDTSDAEDSSIILFDDLDKLTVVWEDMPLRTYGANFTFAATLYDNGDITFAYKNIPMTAQELDEKQLDVSIGLADSFLMDKIAYFVRRKASRSYARIAFDKGSVVSDTVLELQAQPSCPTYTNCGDCVRHGEIYSNFKCLWCEKLQKCTSGNDYNRPLLSAGRFLDVCGHSEERIEAYRSSGLNLFNNVFSMKK